MAYIWENEQWPALHWDDQVLGTLLAHVSREHDRLRAESSPRWRNFSSDLQSRATPIPCSWWGVRICDS